jgi:hypothetical protein
MKKLLLILLIYTAVGCYKDSLTKVDFLVRQPTPKSSRIIDNDTVHLGWFDKPFVYPDVRFPGSRWSWRQKQWQYISATSERYVVGMSCVDVGYLSNFFLFVFDFQTKKYVEFESKGLFGKGVKIAQNSLTGISSYTSKNCKLTVNNNYAQGFYNVVFDCSDKLNRAKGDLIINVHGDPLVNIREAAPKRIVYTHQSATYRPEGTVVLNDDTIRFDPEKDFSSFDYTQGRHLHKTNWNWASAGGFTDAGIPVAITFSSATGYFYWINGSLNRVADLSFKYTDINSHWQLKSGDSAIQLNFVPVGKRVGKTNVLGLLVSVFQQPFGTFSGTIRLPDGSIITPKTLRGVTEDHIAKW